MVIDPYPLSDNAPDGIHGLMWAELEGGGRYDHPPAEPLTQVSYASGEYVTAYVEPLAVNATLTDMPLFLNPQRYVSLPLETTYTQAYEGMPKRWKRVLEEVSR